MHKPSYFQIESLPELQSLIDCAPLANVIVNTVSGLVATPIPLFLHHAGGEYGTLHGHISRASWHPYEQSEGEGLAPFMGPEAHISPSWYVSKQETGKVVPTWNYVTVQAFGPAGFYDDRDGLLTVVTQLTNIHEQVSAEPWRVTDAPPITISTAECLRTAQICLNC